MKASLLSGILPLSINHISHIYHENAISSEMVYYDEQFDNGYMYKGYVVWLIPSLSQQSLKRQEGCK